MSYQAVGGGGDGAYGAGGAGGAQYQDLEAPRKPGRAGTAGAGAGTGAYQQQQQQQQQQHADGFVPVGQPAPWAAAEDAPFAEALADMDVQVRHGFVRKVFGILSMQLLMTFGWVLLVSNNSGLRNYHATHTWPLFLGLSLSLGSMIGMICFVDLVRSHPGNYIMLAVFTVAESLMLGGLGGTVDSQLIAVAVGTTLAVSVGIILFAMQTRFDFTGAGPYLFVALWSMIIFSMISSLAGQSAEQSKVYAGFGVVLFSFFLVYGALPSCPAQRPSLAVPSTDLFTLLLPRRRRPACRGRKAQQVPLLCRRLRLRGSCDLPRHHKPVPASSFFAFGPPLAARARNTTVLITPISKNCMFIKAARARSARMAFASWSSGRGRGRSTGPAAQGRARARTLPPQVLDMVTSPLWRTHARLLRATRAGAQRPQARLSPFRTARCRHPPLGHHHHRQPGASTSRPPTTRELVDRPKTARGWKLDSGPTTSASPRTLEPRTG